VTEFLGTSISTTSRVVAGLVAKGLVHRCQSPNDRRQIQLVLTPRGVAVMQKSRRATQSELARELETLESGDQECVAHAMKLLQWLFSSRLCTREPVEAIELKDKVQSEPCRR